MKKLLYTFFLITISFGMAHAQDTLKTNQGVVDGQVVDVQKPRKYYDPKIASRRSAIIPGWGQIYNDSWWKVPIIYAGFGLCIYYIDFNNEQFEYFQDLLSDPDLTDPNLIRQYQAQADNWRKNRDLVFLVTIGVYALQIVEASIDAHLKGFDVDEELALNLKPKVGIINNGTPYVGIGITLPIGR